MKVATEMLYHHELYLIRQIDYVLFIVHFLEIMLGVLIELARVQMEELMWWCGGVVVR